MFVVNGFVNKADGNFELDYRVAKLSDSGISIGSYPINDQDVIQAKNSGCNSVIDIQASYRVMDLNKSLGMFKRQGFNYAIGSPVSDLGEDDYCRTAFDAALKLEELINK